MENMKRRRTQNNERAHDYNRWTGGYIRERVDYPAHGRSGGNGSHNRNRSCRCILSCSCLRSCGQIESCCRIRSCRHIKSCHRIWSHRRSSYRSRYSGMTRGKEGERHRLREGRSKPDLWCKDPENSNPVPGSSHHSPKWQQPYSTVPVAVVTPVHLPDSATDSWLSQSSDCGEREHLDQGPGLSKQCHDRYATNLVTWMESNKSGLQDSWRNKDMGENRKCPLGARDAPLLKMPQREKMSFNHQRKASFCHYVNSWLEVHKIPRNLNNIAKLNEYFSTFGTIVNIQVGPDGDTGAALIQYASPDAAWRAINSTDAVLNNRFIEVRWHRDRKHQDKLISQLILPRSIANEPPHASVRKKPAFISCIMKSTTVTAQKVFKIVDAQEAMKKKQEALKLQLDLKKAKQKMLEKQIECQKVLINRLEILRAMEPMRKTGVMKTLKELSEKICRLKEVVRITAGGKRPLTLDCGVRWGCGVRGGEAKGLGRESHGGQCPLVVDHQTQTFTVLGMAAEEKESVSSVSPAQESVSSVSPAQESVSSVSPAQESVSSVLPAQESVSSELPAQESVSSELPAQESVSSVLPARESVSSVLPAWESVSSVLPAEDDDDDEEDDHESRSWRK